MTKQKVINIKIEHSIDFEMERVFDIVKKINWYRKMGYKITLPCLKINDKTNKKEIKKAIIKEYDANSYNKIGLAIKKNWGGISAKITNNLCRYGFSPRSSYLLFLTKYGAGGGYELPNKIILNFKGKSLAELQKIIIREIIHLLIEPLIKKFNIDHWTKERIVDLIFAKIKSGSAKAQICPIKTKRLDEIFNKFFPDINKILKNIKI